MFMGLDERFILMDLPCIKPLPISSLQELESVGVRTMQLVNISYLNKDWKIIYNIIDDILGNTGLKILLNFWENSPLGTNWLLGGETNYGDPAVGKSIDETTLRFLDGLGNNRDRVNVCYAYRGGEMAWKKLSYRLIPNALGEFDTTTETPPVSDERIAEFIVDRQKILSSQHGEVWTGFLNIPCITYHPKLTVIDNALYQAYPNCKHYRIIHWYFPGLLEYIGQTIPSELSRNQIRDNPKSKYFVGSEWVAGLETNYDEGMEHRVWGFITSPIHPETGLDRVDNKMLATIKIAIEKLSREK